MRLKTSRILQLVDFHFEPMESQKNDSFAKYLCERSDYLDLEYVTPQNFLCVLYVEIVFSMSERNMLRASESVKNKAKKYTCW